MRKPRTNIRKTRLFCSERDMASYEQFVIPALPAAVSGQELDERF
jgi:hypothetical protein